MTPSPYVGLRPFQQPESLLFFGRRQQIAELMDRLHETRFLAVVGSSGCGKSSLIRAGLMPRLEAGFLVENRDRWFFSTLTPGSEPLDRLAASLNIPVSAIKEEGAAAITSHLMATDTGGDRNCFVLVDQFEELFRFAAGNRDQAADFVQILLSLVSQRDFPVFVAITMRSDFLGECDAFTGLPEALNRSQYFVPRLNRQQRREAIEGPVKLFRERMTPQLLDRLVNDVGDEPGQLPVLQHALLRTWEQWTAAGADGPLDLNHYEAIGGIRESLSRDAEAALPATGRSLAERIFRRLTTTDAANRRIRRPALLSELEAVTGGGRQEILRVLEPFHSRSFIVIYERAGGDHLVDISHESLISQWDQLKKWVDAEAESKRIYLDLVTAVERKKALLHDADLQVALEWRKKLDARTEAAWALDVHLAYPQVIAYLDASIKESESGERRRVRQTRLLWGLGTALLAVSVILLPFAYFQLTNARQAESHAVEATRQAAISTQRASEALAQANISKQAAGEAEGKTKATLAQAEDDARQALAVRLGAEAQRLEIRPERPFDAQLRAMLAAQSLRLNPGFEGLNGLLDVLVKLPRRPRHFSLPSAAPAHVIAFSPNGEQLATGHTDGKVFLWNLKTGRVERELGAAPGAVYSLAFDPEGKWLAAGGQQGIAVLSTSSALQSTIRTSNVAKSVWFHPNGELLVAAVQAVGIFVYKKVDGAGGAGEWTLLETIGNSLGDMALFDLNGILVRSGSAGSSPIDRWKWTNPKPNQRWFLGGASTSALVRWSVRDWFGATDQWGAFDPFERLAATLRRDNGIDVWDSRIGAYADSVKAGRGIAAIEAIPGKDSFLVIGKDGEVFLIDAPTASRRVLPSPGFWPRHWWFHPSRPLVALSDSAGNGAVLDLSRLQIVWQWHQRGGGDVKFDPRGDRLYIEEQPSDQVTGGLRIVSTGAWTQAKLVPMQSRDVLRIEPSGQRIAVEHRITFSRAPTPADVVTIFDARTGAAHETRGNGGSAVYEKWPLLFSPEPDKPEQWVITEGTNKLSDQELIDHQRANGHVVTLPHDAAPTGSAVASNNKWAATASGDIVYLWPLDPARVLERACKGFLLRNLTAKEYETFRVPEKYRIPACPNLPSGPSDK